MSGATAQRTEIYGSVQKCSVMASVLAHLHTFIGSPKAAKRLLQADTTMTDPERENLSYLLRSPRRGQCLTEPSADVERIVYADLQSAWNWFQAQAVMTDKYSIYGLLFKLGSMGVTKDIDVETMLRELIIGTCRGTTLGLTPRVFCSRGGFSSCFGKL
jgi:hypothetical protein